jgi:hypothetical protein
MLGQSRGEREALVAAGFAASLIVYVLFPRPEKLGDIPAAWLLIVFLLPATASITTALFGRLWWRDPVRERDDGLDGVYNAILFRIVAFLIGTHAVVLAVLSGVDWILPWASRLIVVGLGLTVIAIGNVLPRTRPNIVIGIRTSRTMATRDAWIRMHRTAGYVAVAIGAVVVVSGAVAPGQAMPTVVFAAGAIGLATLVVQHRSLRRV